MAPTFQDSNQSSTRNSTPSSNNRCNSRGDPPHSTGSNLRKQDTHTRDHSDVRCTPHQPFLSNSRSYPIQKPLSSSSHSRSATYSVPRRQDAQPNEQSRRFPFGQSPSTIHQSSLLDSRPYRRPPISSSSPSYSKPAGHSAPLREDAQPNEQSSWLPPCLRRPDEPPTIKPTHSTTSYPSPFPAAPPNPHYHSPKPIPQRYYADRYRSTSYNSYGYRAPNPSTSQNRSFDHLSSASQSHLNSIAYYQSNSYGAAFCHRPSRPFDAVYISSTSDRYDNRSLRHPESTQTPPYPLTNTNPI